jgi:hypothetical protein
LLALGSRITGNTEFRQNEVEHLIRIHSGIKQKGGSNFPLLQPLEKTVDEGSFSGADFARERDKAFAVLDAIHQAAKRLFNLFGEKEVSRIWIDVERIIP